MGTNIKTGFKNLFIPGATPSLDGLRALAILMVFVTHTIQLIPGVSWVHWNMEWATPLYNGWAGVDLFFVLSGFLIGSAVITGIEEERFSISQFFLRRFFRIVPPYFFVIAAVILISLLYRSLLPNFTLRDIIFNLTFITDYFPAGKMLIPSWSLSIEEQFYVILPFVLLFFRKTETRIQGALWVIIVALILRVCTYRVFSIADGASLNLVQRVIYFPFHTRMDSLSTGVLVALIYSAAPEYLKTYRVIFGQIGVVLVGYVFIFGALQGGFFYTTIQYTLLCLGFGCILWSVLGDMQVKENRLQHILAARIWTPIARISYSLYLTHLLVLNIENHFIQFKLWMFPWIFAGCCSIALVLYLLIEYPCHEYARKKFAISSSNREFKKDIVNA